MLLAVTGSTGQEAPASGKAPQGCRWTEDIDGPHAWQALPATTEMPWESQ